MLKFEGGMFLRILDLLRNLEAIAKLDPAAAHRSEAYRADLNKNIERLIDQLNILDSPMSAKKARSIQLALLLPKEEHGPFTFVQVISQSLEELRDRIRDELDDRTLYCLEPKQAEFLRAGQRHFGNDVVDAFPKASTDMSEAIACLAWGRYTACVFHLMRTIEFALHVVNERLGAQVNQDGSFLPWGNLIRNMDEAIAKLDDKDKRSKWSEAHSLLYHVKECWRNDTMHPKRTYTQEEAIEVFEAVRSFLRSLSILVRLAN